ncbi:IS5/IS1182 family transposase [Actinopolyspora mortivallis]|uniref:IS5/IS1182 family transposase n=1 Tax=Actinopolyspora mortivallis TaxID=33906 RepID=UPI0003793579|nr:IS5/IS1182 family transposase [Actinopolyspora mortivallis]
MPGLVERLVPDELWELFREVVPPKVVRRPQGGGRRRADDREVLAAIVFAAVTDCAWRQLPPVFGACWPTVYRRFVEWSQDRVWTRLHRVCQERLDEREDSEWSRRALDSIRRRGTRAGTSRAETLSR